jgi:hypothetical protein
LASLAASRRETLLYGFEPGINKTNLAFFAQTFAGGPYHYAYDDLKSNIQVL